MEFTFKLNGIQYTDIKGYTSNDRINIGVAGTAQMIRQWIKNAYPSFPIRNYFWVNSETYSGGDSIRVYLNHAPEEIVQKIKELKSIFQEGSFDPYTDSYNYNKSQEKTDDGKVINYGTKYLFIENIPPYSVKAPEVDWTIKSSTKSNFYKKPNYSQSSSSSSGEKKSYPMGDVLKDCAGWVIYKKTLPDSRIVYNCKIKPETAPNKTDWSAIRGEIWTETGFKWGKFGAFEKWGQIASEAFVISKLCEILGKYYKGGEQPSTPTPPPPQAPSPESKAPENQERLPQVGDRFTVKTENSGKVYEIIKLENGRVYVSPVGGGFEVNFDFSEAQNYFKNGVWIRVSENEEKEQKDEQPKAPEKEPEEEKGYSLKNIPANIKLEFCRIVWAEGIAEYSELFPRDFTSFTQLTHFISLYIGELPKEGYDKHKIEWKWKFEEGVNGDRWDVGEKDANPDKYPNLFAYDILRGMCFYAWASGSGGGKSKEELDEADEYYGVMISKSGFELNDEQFKKLLDEFLTYYPKDVKRFKYNTPEERLERFKSVYPKLYSVFNAPIKSKESIQKAIKGLQYLANKGDEKAKKAIKGLQYLLNK